MKTVGEILSASAAFLENKKIDRPKRLAEEILAHALGLKRIDLYLQFDRPVEETELARMRPWIKRLTVGEPLEYILGEIEFFGCRIKVDRRVLIPRPETEILVDLIAKRIQCPASLWDVCAGSGCIGLSLKKKFPEIAVSLSDLSSDALALAAENAALNQAAVEILQGDLLEPFAGRKTDLVVVNPPYISESEYFSLDPSVREFEPKMALIGGERGTEFYERLQRDLPRFLNPGARVFLEIGSTQGDAVQRIFSSPIWEKLELLADWSGKDRFIFLEMQ
jgi:release factor glutamine methyltransferase